MRGDLPPRVRVQMLEETRNLLRELAATDPLSPTLADLVTTMRSTRRRDSGESFETDEDDLRMLLSIVEGGDRYTADARMRAGLAIADHPLAAEDLARYVDPLFDSIENETDLEHRSELLGAVAPLTQVDDARFARTVRLAVVVLQALVEAPRDEDPDDWRTLVEDALNQAESLCAQAREDGLLDALAVLAEIGRALAFERDLPKRLRATAMRFSIQARPDRRSAFVPLLSDADVSLATNVANELGSRVRSSTDPELVELQVLAARGGAVALVGIKGIWKFEQDRPGPPSSSSDGWPVPTLESGRGPFVPSASSMFPRTSVGREGLGFARSLSTTIRPSFD